MYHVQEKKYHYEKDNIARLYDELFRYRKSLYNLEFAFAIDGDEGTLRSLKILRRLYNETKNKLNQHMQGNTKVTVTNDLEFANIMQQLLG